MQREEILKRLKEIDEELEKRKKSDRLSAYNKEIGRASCRERV